MSEEPRRTIEELIARYETEPSLRDLFVEGNLDAHLIKWFFQQNGCNNVAVYQINTVNVSPEKVASYKLENNNKGRVIALAFELESALGKDCIQATCVADKDMDIILDKSYDCTLLLFTDYTSMEIYLYNEECLEKYFSIVLRISLSAKLVLDEFSNILQGLFLVRLVNYLIKLKLTQLSFDRFCTLRDGKIFFDFEEYVTRYLNRNNLIHRRHEFVENIESFKPMLTENPKFQIHGHDFMELLSWYISELGVDCKLYTLKVVEHSLFGCLEIGQLSGEKLFITLLTRIR